MASTLPSLALTLYTRPGCHLCEVALQDVRGSLETRAAAGLAVPSLVEVDISTDAELERRYLVTIPVLRYGESLLELAVQSRAIRRFLTDVLDSAAVQGTADPREPAGDGPAAGSPRSRIA